MLIDFEETAKDRLGQVAAVGEEFGVVADE
jgi:hypothetical protein